MICIIQARLSSKRLPHKMLKKIYHKVLIDRVVEQVSKSKKVNKIIVATSNHYSDDKLVNHCKRKNIDFYRSSLNNVAKRFNDISKKFNPKAFIRINGDSPLIDYRLISLFINKFNKNNYDILTNSYLKTFPKGQGIEIIKSKIFQKEYKKIKTKYDLEHVFPYFYRNKHKFKFKNISYKKNLNHINFSVDTYSDFLRIQKIIRKNKNKIPSLAKLIYDEKL